MAIPTQAEMFEVTLALMADGAEHTRKGLIERAREDLGLSADEAEEKTSSGVPVYASRVGWSIAYLSRSKLVARVRRGVYAISDDGRAALVAGMSPAELTAYINKRIATLNPWATAKSKEHGAGEDASAEGSPAPNEAVSPYERLDSLAKDLDESLADELLALIMDRDPAFFEKVVVDLLEKMGYGKGSVTRYSSDGGIDGLVTTDELGFRPICTQAKRYAPDHKVGRAAVQAFVGALNGAPNGVFITTSSFTKEASEFAEGYPNATIALVDGRRLAELMIKYDLGVATEQVVRVKRVDSDYFDEQ